MTVGVHLNDLEPAGNERILMQTLLRSPKGGMVSATVAAVHEHSCPFWRIGKRHGPCDCGALEAWDEIFRESTLDVKGRSQPAPFPLKEHPYE